MIADYLNSPFTGPEVIILVLFAVYMLCVAD